MMYHLLQCKNGDVLTFLTTWLQHNSIWGNLQKREGWTLRTTFCIFENKFDLKIIVYKYTFGKSNSAKFIRIRLQKSFVSKLWRREAFNLDCIRDGKEGGPDNLEIRVGNCARINSEIMYYQLDSRQNCPWVITLEGRRVLSRL